jgi:hypothetical protein
MTRTGTINFLNMVKDKIKTKPTDSYSKGTTPVKKLLLAGLPSRNALYLPPGVSSTGHWETRPLSQQ